MRGFIFMDTDLDTQKNPLKAKKFQLHHTISFNIRFDQELIIISNFILFDKLKYLVSFKYQSFQNSNEP